MDVRGEFNEAILLKHLPGNGARCKRVYRHWRRTLPRVVCILSSLLLLIPRAGYLRHQTGDVPQPH